MSTIDFLDQGSHFQVELPQGYGAIERLACLLELFIEFILGSVEVKAWMSFLQSFSQYRKILLRLLGLQDLVEGGELAILVFLDRVTVSLGNKCQDEPN